MRFLICLPLLLLLFACNTKTTTEQPEQQSKKLSEPNPELEEERVPVSKPEVATFDKQYLPEGFQIITYGDSISNIIRGNFNGNEAEDVAVFAVSDYNDDEYNTAKAAHILIFEDDGNNGFELRAKSGNLIDFVNPYPSNQLELNKNVIIATHQAMRWNRTLKFRYQPKNEDYMLIGSEYENFGNATNDGSGTISTNYLTGVQIENLNAFDYEKEELNALPEKKNKVSTKLQSLSAINGENFYDF